jgi:hypothetical protein
MRLDSKPISKSIQGVGGNLTFERNTIEVQDGRRCIGLVLKMTLPVKNTTGGALALSDANRQLLLALFTINVTLGMKSKVLQLPYQNVTLARIHHLARETMNKEQKGYADSTNGLATSMANNATTNEVFYLTIPTGILWSLFGDYRDLWGMGPTQAKMLEVFIKCTGSNIAAGWDLNLGTATFELAPVVVDADGDIWSPLYVYEEKDEVNKTLSLPPGLLLSLHERTQVQASDPLTNLSFSIGNQKMFQLLAAADRAWGFEEAPLLTSAGYPSDRETVIYEVTDGEVSFEDMRVGEPKLTQDTKDLATFKAGVFYVPVLDANSIAAHVDYIAKSIKKAKTKAVSMADVTHMHIPDELRPFVPFYLFTEEDPRFEQFAGLVGYVDDTPPQVAVPKSMLARLKTVEADLRKHGEDAAADNLVKRVALQVPGAVEGVAGLRTGNSGIHNAVRRLFG